MIRYLCLAATLFVVGCTVKTNSACPDDYSPTDQACAWHYCQDHAEDVRCVDASAPVDGMQGFADASSLDGSFRDIDATQTDSQVEASVAVDAGCPTCRECTQELDCAGKPGGRTHCATTGQCVACETNAQCTLASAPHCEANVCTGCKAAAECTRFPTTPLCAASSGQCVACESNAECKTTDKPICEANSCRACKADTDCAGAGKVCRETTGQCVDCEPNAIEPEKETCTNGKACDPLKLTCTGFARRSLNFCGKVSDGSVKRCVSDSECIANHRCVKTEFPIGTPYGSYCLPQAGDQACPNQVAVKRTSSSALGVMDSYCFPNDNYTTCEGLLSFRNSCSDESGCGASDQSDGLCEQSECTYRCDSDRDCSGSVCVGAAGARYCNSN